MNLLIWRINPHRKNIKIWLNPTVITNFPDNSIEYRQFNNKLQKKNTSNYLLK